VRLPHRLVLCLGYCNEWLSRMTRREPRIPLEGVKMAHRHMFFDASKAVAELSLPQTPIEQALSEAVAWYRENGYVTVISDQ
jgi:dihydroflavonol-4-reductase